MFELPEVVTLARQVNETLRGKRIKRGTLGNSPHKFVWYNRSHKEFERLTKGKTIGEALAKGRWLFIPLDPGYVLVLGECGGKVLCYAPGAKTPKKYHLYLAFDDDSFFTVTTQMWGAMELYKKGTERTRKYIKDMRTTPLEPGFTFEYFSALMDHPETGEKRTAKGLLTQDQIIPGLGNAIAQDILFRARVHPKQPVGDLTKNQRRALYRAVLKTVREIIAKGGRYDEYDLHNEKGKYVRIMDKNAAGRPCPQCGTEVEKMQYLGGTCYFCPRCQKREK
jgi:formamidopyrimidine-DNA glycosylase